MFYFTGSTNSLPKGRTVPSVILGCTAYLSSIVGTFCHMYERASQAIASPTVAYLSWSLLPQSPVSHGRFSRSHVSCGRFSHSCLSLAVASPDVASLAVASLTSHFSCSHLLLSCSCISCSHISCSLISLQSHFLQSLIAGLSWV